MNLRSEIQRLARQFDEEDEAAFALWSWLPSHAAAEKHHGDYAIEHRPSVADIMRESAMVLAEKAGYPTTDADRAEWFACPCGESHERRGSDMTATNGLTTEIVRRVWVDDTGERFEVGDDRDGLDMTEICWRDPDGKVCNAVQFTDAQLPALIAALQARAAEKGL